MPIFENIVERRRRASIPSLKTLQARSMSHADCHGERDVDHASAPKCATKSLYVFDSAVAARLAARLMAAGSWFECEQLDREKWYFAVAPAGHARLVALHETLTVPLASRECGVLRSPLSPEAGGRIHS